VPEAMIESSYHGLQNVLLIFIKFRNIHVRYDIGFAVPLFSGFLSW
jgi:hypothetical protein